jgi:hypothetical protein
VLPSLLLAAAGARLYEKKNPVGYLFVILSQFYTNLLIVGTCTFAFNICTSFYGGESKFGVIPYLLWSWVMALGPWQSFRSDEPDNVFEAIALLSATIFYFLFLISSIFFPFGALIVFALFILVQLFVVPIFNMYMANRMQKNTF